MIPEVEELLKSLEEDHPTEGIQESLEYLEKNPETEYKSDLAYGIATGYFRLEQYEKALDWLEKTDDDRRDLFKGFCLLELNDFREADRVLRDVGNEQPERKDHCDLVRAQALFLNEDLDDAQVIYEDLLGRNLDDQYMAETFFGLALLEMSRENYGEARDSLKTVVEEFENTDFYLEGLFHLIQSLEKLGKIDTAIEYARTFRDKAVGTDLEQEASEMLSHLQQQRNSRESKLQNYEY